MPRYEVKIVLTLDAESQHEAAVLADEFAELFEDSPLANLLPEGDTSLRIRSISWPVD